MACSGTPLKETGYGRVEEMEIEMESRTYMDGCINGEGKVGRWGVGEGLKGGDEMHLRRVNAFMNE